MLGVCHGWTHHHRLRVRSLTEQRDVARALDARLLLDEVIAVAGPTRTTCCQYLLLLLLVFKKLIHHLLLLLDLLEVPTLRRRTLLHEQ